MMNGYNFSGRVEVGVRRAFLIVVILLLLGISSLSATTAYVSKFCDCIDLTDHLENYPVLKESKLRQSDHQRSPKMNKDYSGRAVIASLNLMGNDRNSKMDDWINIEFDFSDLPFTSIKDPVSRRDIKILLVAHSSMILDVGSRDFPNELLSGIGWDCIQYNGIFNNGQNFLIIDSQENVSSVKIKFLNKLVLHYPDYWVDIVLMLPPVENESNLAISDDYWSTIKVNVNDEGWQELKLQGTYKKPVKTASRILLDVNPLPGSHMNLRNLEANRFYPVADVDVLGEFISEKDVWGYALNPPELDLYIGSNLWEEDPVARPFMMYRSGDQIYVPVNSFPYELKLTKSSGNPFYVMQDPNWDTGSQRNSVQLSGEYDEFIRLKPTIHNLDFALFMTDYAGYMYDNRLTLSMRIDNDVYNRIHDQSGAEPMMPGIYTSDIYFYLISNR